MNYTHQFPSADRPSVVEDIRAEIRGIRTRPARKTKSAPPPPDFDQASRLFTVCTGNRWMELGERLPLQKCLFGDFWRQGELCIMFAAANAGKSILAVQIGDALSRGRSPAPFAPRSRPVKVLYVDFELSTPQFCTRYSGRDGNYIFSDNFMRAQFNPDPGLYHGPSADNDLIFAAIEQKVHLVNATVLIIDNITCLRGGTENASVALGLMQSLKALKSSLNLSILVLAHAPKRRSPSRPLSADDLHGSKLLMNFADSAFTIGAALRAPQCALRGPQYDINSGLCYLKQIKQRNTEQRYGADNVCLCRIVKRNSFLRFKFEGHSAERLHLPNAFAIAIGARRQMLARKAAALSADGFSQRQISKKLGVSLGMVNKLLRG